MLWVEQPVGTGFSIGKPNATSEEDVSSDFIKFFKNFEVSIPLGLGLGLRRLTDGKENIRHRI